ncbi:hypothetical protein G7Y89_g12849 [Cudoniella acicularis]|uniref:Glucose-methanol-choline oxidoreductase N-terminal domain-containing protein n=1 Tax=Cudoniella acicularis TaxID=354080 RepID=A0A8H4VWL1_9HELO|nr:hypothetical protein G7Y89_g12849 [Cudoniella acicularis]
MTSPTQFADYIVVGGGIGGSVVASRLTQRDTKLAVILLEAGSDPTNHPLVPDASTALQVRGTELNWNYTTIDQENLGGRACNASAGKALGGGSAINSGGWIRGDAKDYDHWAKVVNDPRWSYKGFLPYFRKTETYHDAGADRAQHGFSGPIHTQTAPTSNRNYPMREQTKAAFNSIGIKEIKDANCGNPQGLAECTEAWKNGKRQLASHAYPLNGVQVMTGKLVKRVIIEEKDNRKVALGVELSDGSILGATREVILCAGTYRTPQVLMLSGIGSASELLKHNIPQILDLPEVGKNLHDHLGTTQFWKLRNPEKGLSAGSPNFNNPAYMLGLPLDWVAVHTVPAQGLKDALVHDGEMASLDVSHTQLDDRSQLEFYIIYAAASADPPIPFDGTHISSSVVGLLPTSRGSVTISSNNPHDDPVIDPNYYATEHDKYVMRSGLKLVGKMLLETQEGLNIVTQEAVPDGLKPLSSILNDEDLDARVRASGNTLFHPGGTASMGKVVDSHLRVIGIEGLRIVDASVIPVPIASHYQACIFALGEQAVDLILDHVEEKV